VHSGRILQPEDEDVSVIIDLILVNIFD
jgi:hypothetical protein